MCNLIGMRLTTRLAAVAAVALFSVACTGERDGRPATSVSPAPDLVAPSSPTATAPATEHAAPPEISAEGVARAGRETERDVAALAYVGADGTLRIWLAQGIDGVELAIGDATCVGADTKPPESRTIAWSPQGNRFACLDPEGHVLVVAVLGHEDEPRQPDVDVRISRERCSSVPTWASDGSRLACKDGDRLRLFTAAVSPVANLPCVIEYLWSTATPHLVARPCTGGLLLVDADGREVASVDWEPPGNLIWASAPDRVAIPREGGIEIIALSTGTPGTYVVVPGRKPLLAGWIDADTLLGSRAAAGVPPALISIDGSLRPLDVPSGVLYVTLAPNRSLAVIARPNNADRAGAVEVYSISTGVAQTTFTVGLTKPTGFVPGPNFWFSRDSSIICWLDFGGSLWCGRVDDPDSAEQVADADDFAPEVGGTRYLTESLSFDGTTVAVAAAEGAGYRLVIRDRGHLRSDVARDLLNPRLAAWGFVSFP